MSQKRAERGIANQVIVLTAQGAGAIAVVRFSGEGVSRFMGAHFSRALAVGRCVHGNLVEGDEVIDDGIAVLLPGERGVDLSVHGGSWVVQRVLELAGRNGFEKIAADDERVVQS